MKVGKILLWCKVMTIHYHSRGPRIPNVFNVYTFNTIAQVAFAVLPPASVPQRLRLLRSIDCGITDCYIRSTWMAVGSSWHDVWR